MYALASAASWGIADYAGGVASRTASLLLVVASSQAIGLLAALGILFAAGESVPAAPALVWACVAGVSGVVGLGAFYRALSQGAMGLVAPLSAVIGAGLPALVGVVLGEELLPAHVVGIACALVAVVLTGRPVESAHADPRQLPLVLVAGFGFAGFFVAMDQAGRAGGGMWWLMISARVAGLALVTLAILAVAPRPTAPPRGLVPLFLLAGVGDLGGNAFFLLANEQGQLSIAAVLSSLYPVVTVALASLFLGERLGRAHLAGVGLALLAVALVAAARPGPAPPDDTSRPAASVRHAVLAGG